MAESSGHLSVRPALPDDVVVELRLRLSTLDALRAGLRVTFLRLDVVPCAEARAFALYDIYVETLQDIAYTGAIAAETAPHSPGFRSARGGE